MMSIHQDNTINNTQTSMHPLFLPLLEKSIFEFDKSVNQRSVHIPSLPGYYGQGDTKAKAFSELVEGYLDTYDK